MVTIRQLDAEQAQELLPEFIEVLRDSVDNGASVGFLSPLEAEEAKSYWVDTFAEVRLGTRILLGAFFEQRLIGTVQLALATKPNGQHRAEVQKLMVYSRFRNQGIARALMAEIENAAHLTHRTLLVLDTRRGDDAEKLCAKLGYIEAGAIPQYALSSNGTLHETVLFYRLIRWDGAKFAVYAP